MKTPTAVVIVSGGVVQGVHVNQPIDVLVIDCDTDGADDRVKTLVDTDGDKFQANVSWDAGVINKKIVNHYLKQVGKE